MKQIIALSLVFILLISGCSLVKEPKTVTVVKEVKIPVYQELPEIRETVYPYLPINSLTEADSDDPVKVGKAYVLSIEILDGYIQELETILDTFREYSKNGVKK